MRTRLLLAALCTLTTGCNGATDSVPGQLTGRLDGEEWRATAVIWPGPADEPTIHSRRVTETATRGIGIAIPGTAPGTYPVAPGGVWYYAQPRSGDAYYANAIDGTLTLTSVTGDELRGTFEATLAGPGGDILELTGGEFFVPLGAP